MNVRILLVNLHMRHDVINWLSGLTIDVINWLRHIPMAGSLKKNIHIFVLTTRNMLEMGRYVAIMPNCPCIYLRDLD